MSGRPRAVALLSGGLDSGAAAAMWCADGGEVSVALCADYGQLAARRERAASARIAERLGAAWRGVELPWLGAVARAHGSALVAGAGVLPPARDESDPGDAASAAAVWVPARNLVLIAVAAAFAEASGCGVIVAGFNAEEAATFADNSAGFVSACDAVLEFATRSGVRVVSPTLGMDKKAIVARARQLGLQREDFWSCYLAESDPRTCACESCVRSRVAWGR